MITIIISFFDPSLVMKEPNVLSSFSCTSRSALKLGLGMYYNYYNTNLNITNLHQ